MEYFPDIISSVPMLKYLLYIYNFIFGTTRNGIFIGFFYLVIGFLFSKYKNQIRKFRPSSCVCVCSCFLVVACGYLISNILGNMFINIPKQTIIVILIFYNTFAVTESKKEGVKWQNYTTRTLRDMGTIIYLSHSVIILIVDNILRIHNIFLFYLLVIIISTILALVIIKMADKIKWLRKLY